jgi:hypothetical protein
MKLLAKTVEARYQTAAAVERDLKRCLAGWQAEGRIDDFSLGENDIPDRLLIPEKLYGREREVKILLAAFDRMIESGAPELVLVSGYSGIGKSAVVNELQKSLVPARGLFAAGKFDQYKRDIPYLTLVQAFQSLVRPLLSKSDAPDRHATSPASPKGLCTTPGTRRGGPTSSRCPIRRRRRIPPRRIRLPPPNRRRPVAPSRSPLRG